MGSHSTTLLHSPPPSPLLSFSSLQAKLPKNLSILLPPKNSTKESLLQYKNDTLAAYKAVSRQPIQKTVAAVKAEAVVKVEELTKLKKVKKTSV